MRLLRRLRSADLDLAIHEDGGRLRLLPPDASLSQADLRHVARHKAAILALLRQERDQDIERPS